MRTVALAAVVLSLAPLVAACTGDSEPVPDQGATLPTPAEPDTLLPVPDNTLAPDVTDTLPPDLLFGGNLCGALSAADIAAVPIAGSAGARLVEAVPVADDQCQFVVSAGSRRTVIIVKARSLDDFVNPSPTGEPIDEIKGLGLAARGVQHPDDYEVLVKVDKGFFAVVAPNRATAEALAARAIPRVDDPASPPAPLPVPAPPDSAASPIPTSSTSVSSSPSSPPTPSSSPSSPPTRSSSPSSAPTSTEDVAP